MKKTAIITGVTGGIGSAIAHELVSQGYRVVGLSRSQPADDVEHIYCDLADINSAKQVSDELFVKEKSVDLVVLAAGVGHFGSAENLSVKQVTETMAVNFSSQAIIVNRLIASMKKKRAGRIIAIGSEAALAGAKMGSVYCASKFALRGYCQSLRHECRQASVSVSMLHPGLVKTDFYEESHFEPASEQMHSIDLDNLLIVFRAILSVSAHAVIEECVLQPMSPKVIKK